MKPWKTRETDHTTPSRAPRCEIHRRSAATATHHLIGWKHRIRTFRKPPSSCHCDNAMCEDLATFVVGLHLHHSTPCRGSVYYVAIKMMNSVVLFPRSPSNNQTMPHEPSVYYVAIRMINSVASFLRHYKKVVIFWHLIIVIIPKK